VRDGANWIVEGADHHAGMPNWCTNRLTITGPEEQVALLHSQVRHNGDGVPILLASLHPMPEELTYTSAPNRDASPEQLAYLEATYGATDWYAWATSTAGWGTKWADCETVEDAREPGRLVYRFESAWSPPVEGVKNISARFPALTFSLEYAEPGCDFSGTATMAEGLLLTDDCRDSCDSEFALECGYGVDDDDLV